MKYSAIATLFKGLSLTTRRLKKTYLLAEFLQTLEVKDLDHTILLLQGRVFPEWDKRNVGLAGKLVLKGLSLATGHSIQVIEAKVKETGDIGKATEELTQTKKQQTLFAQPLTIEEVFQTFRQIATYEGMKSQDMKLSSLNKLLTSATPNEAKFIVRTVLEDLRVGIAEGTLRDAIAFAFFTKEFDYDEDNNILNHEMLPGLEIGQVKDKVKRALDLTADVTTVIKAIKEGQSLDEITLQPGKPCKPMLARKEKTFDEAFARTQSPARVEYKYDGFRLQIHKDNDNITLFTRRLEDVTTQFPDVVKAIQEHVKPAKCILDGEAVGYDPQNGKYQPFQHISQRIRRKYDIKELVEKLPVEVNIFDVLLCEETSYLDEPLTKRLEVMDTLLHDIEQTKKRKDIRLVQGITVKSTQEAQEFFEQSLADGNEGVMLKDMQGTYEPGNRVTAWIKMKPTMDELDLVIVEAEWGTGKRSEWMTSFTLACLDDEGNYVTIGKVGTGLKELESEGLTFGQVTELLKPHIISESGKIAKVKPHVVLEIAYEEIQKSTAYSSGYALRFPRVLRNRTDERSANDIATVDDIIDLFESQ